MTAPLTATTADRRDSPDTQLERFVSARVGSLQRGYLDRRADEVGALARLRRAVTSAPGADPATWGETLSGMPEALLGRGDEPSAHERAAHAAITVYAVHQQSQSTAMHRAGQSLGTAVRTLGQRTSADEAVRRRFQALGTATSLPETLHHLRGLVTHLRSKGIALDYGRLARDLRLLQRPATADGVRLAWGRDYYRPQARDDASGDTAEQALPVPTATGEQ